MSIGGKSFLSPERRVWQTHVLTTDKYRRWLDLAECLRSIAMEIFQRTHSARSDVELIAALTFARAFESFESGVHQLEGGFIGDARTIVRSAVESAIALGALSQDAGFVARLVEAEQARKLKIARQILSDPTMRAECSAERVARIEASIAEIEAEVKKPQGIVWDQVAQGPYKQLYNSLYRLMSGDGTHVTLEALNNRHVTTDKADSITGLRMGPTPKGWRSTMHGVCTAILWAMVPTMEIFGMKTLEEDLGNRLKPFSPLLQDDAESDDEA